MSTTISPTVYCLRCVCKLRATQKSGTANMVIRNVEAMKWLVKAVLAATPQEEEAADAIAKKKLDDETRQYLAGQKRTIPFEVDGGLSNADLGEML